MKRYEIINPSDECYLSGNDLEAVCAAGLMLGKGKYGINEVDGDEAMPIFLFGGHDEWWQGKFGHVFADYFVEKNYAAVAAVLKTFRYASTRSSMNNIGKAAKANAKALEAVLKKAKAPAGKAG